MKAQRNLGDEYGKNAFHSTPISKFQNLDYIEVDALVTVVDVAKYIIHEMGEITTMRLHKLCYYSQGWTLAWTDAPLFCEDFMAFACGPVCGELLELHRGVFILKDGDFGDYDAHSLSEDERESIDVIIESYGKKYSPFQLTQLVHQDLPWLAMRKYLKFGAECRNIISKESMREYYYGLYNAIDDDVNDDATEDEAGVIGAPADNDPGVGAPKDNDPGVGAPKNNDPGIINVAKYIIDIYGNLNPLQLEYLCYYSQAWSLAWFEVPIFDEDFYAWPQGPISPVLHEAISDYACSFDYFLDDYDENALDEKQKKCIGTVFRDLSIIPPDTFLAMPLKEDPWLRVCKKDDTLISKETMLDYYAGQLVPAEVREELENELGIRSEEENSHWKMAYDQVASVSESFDDIEEEKNKLIDERNKLVDETNKLIEEIKKLVGETNRVNVPVRRWKRSRGKLRPRALGLCK